MLGYMPSLSHGIPEGWWLQLNSFDFYFDLRMQAYVYVNLFHVGGCFWNLQDGIGFSRAGDVRVCELSDMGSENQPQVPCRNSTHVTMPPLQHLHLDLSNPVACP